MLGQEIYIKGIQKEVPDRNDNIIVGCGSEKTWGYKEIQVSKFHCCSEKELRNKYAEKDYLLTLQMSCLKN